MVPPKPKLKPAVAPVRRREEKAAQPGAEGATGAMQPVFAGEGFAPSGIPGLDELMGGPFEQSSTTMVAGDAGCGKTTLLCQFLYRGAVDYGEPGVLLSFEEPSPFIFKHMLSYGMDFAALEEQNLFATINYRPHEVKKLVEEGGGLIWDTISSLGAKRLAIDSLTSYSMLFDSHYQAREAELLLFDLLHKWKCTSLLSSEGMIGEGPGQQGGMEYLADGVILLHHPRYQSSRYRAIEVLKMRGRKHSEKMCPFEFVDGEGIRIYPGENIFYEIKEKEG